MRRELILLALLAAAGNCRAASDAQSVWAVRMGNGTLLQAPIRGGNLSDSASGLAVDASGNIYVAGTTYSPAFPGSGAPMEDEDGNPVWRVWIGKLKPDGSEFDFVVFLDHLRSVAGLALDPAGNIVVAGDTLGVPADAPASLRAGPLGYYSIYVVKLNPTGAAIPFTAYVGGTGDDDAAGVAVDAVGAIYVTGRTSSTDFPVTAGAFQSNPAGSFVVKLDPTGNRLVYSTYLGGKGNDWAASIAVDGSGAAYIAGSADYAAGGFPVTAGALQATPGYGFAAKLNSSGSALVYGTYLPFGAKMAIDAGGNAYLAGWAGGNLPVTPGAFQSTPGSACVAKLNAAGSAFLYATYFGGSQGRSPSAIAVDAAGNFHIAGWTYGGLPVFQAIEPSFFGGACPQYTESGDLPVDYVTCYDGFAAALDPSGSKLLYSTYLNGPYNNGAAAVAVDRQGAVYVAGSGETYFPVSTPVSDGGSAFVVKLGAPQARPAFTSDSVTNAASFVSGLVPPGGISTVFCSGLTGISGIVTASQLPLPTQIQGVTVKVGGVSAPLFAVADVNDVQQINFQVPFESACCDDVEIWQNGVFAAVIPNLFDISPPGVFTVDGVYGAIQHLDYSPVTSSSPANRGEVVILYATGLGQVTPPVETGWPAPLATISTTVQTPLVTIGGRPAEVLFSGLTPGAVGLYQLNVRVPPDAPTGDLNLVVSLPPVTENDVPDVGRYPVTYPRDSQPIKLSVR